MRISRIIAVVSAALAILAGPVAGSAVAVSATSVNVACFQNCQTPGW
ncbi:hypothetical protein JNUCC0626_14175 [Lentzea sp. JNUCC 0626]